MSSNEMFSADDVLRMLSVSLSDRRSTIKTITNGASIRSLVLALENATDASVRQILCDVLGSRPDARSVPPLLKVLSDLDPGVRAAAADALAKIGDINSGPTLFSRFQSESDNDVRQMLILAIGSVKYEPAIPALIDSLEDTSDMLRGCAAWALGNLKADRAVEPLRKALANEQSEYASHRMKHALRKILNSE